MIELESRGKNLLKVEAEEIENHFRGLLSDLSLLSHEFDVHSMPNNDIEAVKSLYADEFMNVGQLRDYYDHLRLLDKTGKEIIRVNFSGGKVYIVPERKLQSKSDQYYFKKIIQFGKEYLSPPFISMLSKVKFKNL